MVIRILIADDHPIVREGLSAVLETQPDFAVAGQAASGPEAVALAERLRPDVVLLDLELPGMDGVAALREMRARLPEVRALIFTAFDTDERILGAVQAGAQGYLLKGAPREELFQAIRVVHSGGSLLQPVVAARLIRAFGRTEGRGLRTEAGGRESSVLSPQSSALAESLTERELEVLQLLARGRQNKEIAGELSISERTVKFHVSAILAKLGVGNRTEAVSKAAQLGLVEL
ncbi:MAG TPA: response regulator transcription factor [Roseiflexaceae bacterium]|nr:response regulator transcription factor [Roseiflexaceae bacterium]